MAHFKPGFCLYFGAANMTGFHQIIICFAEFDCVGGDTCMPTRCDILETFAVLISFE